MSRKRKRGFSGVDSTLVDIYEQLANEDEQNRIDAAHSLISRFIDPDTFSFEQAKGILSRLFRGLCSSRKAARLGFSIALTESLSHLPLSTNQLEDGISTSAVIDLLESKTVPDGSVSGQDERDHYFGRLFGAEAILKSGIIFKDSDHASWKRLLEVICSLAVKKNWLRQECGWVLYNFIFSSASDLLTEQHVLEILEALSERKLIRTPEGVAVWLVAVDKFPRANIPRQYWRHGDPLSHKDVVSLAEILKDTHQQSGNVKDDFESQGAASWSGRPHFAWDVVFGKLYQESEDGTRSVAGQKIEKKGQKKVKGTSENPRSEQVSFETFWKVVVDGIVTFD